LNNRFTFFHILILLIYIFESFYKRMTFESCYSFVSVMLSNITLEIFFFFLFLLLLLISRCLFSCEFFAFLSSDILLIQNLLKIKI